MLLPIILGLVAVGMLCLGAYGSKSKYRHEGAEVAGWMVGAVLGIAFILTSILCPIQQQAKLQEMRAFYESNAQNYQTVVEETQLILSEQQFIDQALVPIQGSIEKTELARVVSDRLVEWRDAVNNYNIDLKKMQYFDDHILVGFYYPVPTGLKQLVIK